MPARSTRTPLILLCLAASLTACDGRSSRGPGDSPRRAADAPLPDGVVRAVEQGNEHIESRQRAVRAWQGYRDRIGTEPCPSAPPPPRIAVTAFRQASEQAERTMTHLTTAEIEGAPDPSLPPSVAEDLAEVHAAMRGSSASSTLRWMESGYTSEEHPFSPGPLAERLQLDFAMARRDRTDAARAQELVDGLTGNELILVEQARIRPEVDRSTETFTSGLSAGTALLYSYRAQRVVCAGRFSARNEAANFRSWSERAVGSLPEEELTLRAYHSAAVGLRSLTADEPTAGEPATSTPSAPDGDHQAGVDDAPAPATE